MAGKLLQNCFETEGNSTEERRFSAYLGPSRSWTTQSPVFKAGSRDTRRIASCEERVSIALK
jgi:hypothetical protein